jgi:hypothetical protein
MSGGPGAEVPPGAIKVDEDFYMVPAGADDDGFPRYRAFTRHQNAPDVIFYRRRDGSFTPNKALAREG